MEIEYQNSRQNFVDLYKIHFKTTIQKRLTFIAIFSFFIVGSMYNEYHTLSQYISGIICLFILLPAVCYFLPLFIFNFKLKKRFNKVRGYVEYRRLIITDEGLLSEVGGLSKLINWETIKSADSNSKFIVVKLVDKKILLIPKAAFNSDTDSANFLGLIIFRNKKINSNYYQNISLNKKPDYSWGFLCLIPLIGAFAGAVFLLNGIFKYKDKWFIIIGIAGILFTVGFYTWLNYSTTNDPFFKASFVQTDKQELNNFVKQVEFYKIQNGVYPDSLQQLDLKGEAISISDPLLNFSGDKTGVFNYHKIGNKYTLFSSGLDKTPNTSDDIYPTLKIDTSKIGLIINKR